MPQLIGRGSDDENDNNDRDDDDDWGKLLC